MGGRDDKGGKSGGGRDRRDEDRDDKGGKGGKSGGDKGGKEGRPGDWWCPACGAGPVFASKDSCFKCGAPRPEGAGGAVQGKGGKDGKGKGDKDKDDKGKGKKGKPEKVIIKGLRGKVVQFLAKKEGQERPSGFISRADGEKDVYFDSSDVLDGLTVEQFDPVEFDVIEGSDQRMYAARVKKLPKGTVIDSANSKAAEPITASKAGSLTGSLTGGMSLGPKLGAGKLTGGLSLRPGGLTGSISLTPGGGLAAGKKKEEEKKAEPFAFGEGLSLAAEEGAAEDDGIMWGRIVSVRGSFGFLQPLGSVSAADKGDVFFRAADVVGMNCMDPGDDGVGLEIKLPHGRNANGYKNFWLKADDEVSYSPSKDASGKNCAVEVYKERKGAWRSGRPSRGHRGQNSKQKESLKDMMNRLMEMDTDQVLQNASVFKDVLESPDFNPAHLSKIVSLLAYPELMEDTRSDQLYRIFLSSAAMQASLRTTIIKHSTGMHSGSFLEEILRLFVEFVMRGDPKTLRGQLPLQELAEAWETSLRDGSSATKKGLPEEVMSNLVCLEKNFPDEINLARIKGTRAKKSHTTASDDVAGLMEADYYQDMPILPTSNEMLGQCAFEIQENMRTYDKCEDFIQTHFMLLREDYVEPLRAGIKLFTQGKHSPKDLHVYTGVKVVGILSTWEGIVYRIELQKAQTKKINWEKTKQLMYGSLLCFSYDGFENLIWATVWRRDEDLIKKTGQLDVRLAPLPFDDRLVPGKTFCCIENVTIYFEAYVHVLKGLQSMRPCDVPFQNTLLSPQPEANPPQFLKGESDFFNFHNVFESCMKADATVSAPKSFKVLQEWPKNLLQTLDIDPSQLDAIKHALTHQMALIQGPPGTGKTWVGLKITQAILDNTRNVRQSPILVVCYTNHALDQFLEGIFGFCERITRIGSRSKSEIMQKRNLKELVYECQPSKEYFQARKGLNERRDVLREQLKEQLIKVDAQTVSLDVARELMTEKEFKSFYKGYLEYSGVNPKTVPDDCRDIEEELWDTIMKEFLNTNSDPSKYAPVDDGKDGGLPTADKLYGAEEDEDDDLGPDRKRAVEDEAAKDEDDDGAQADFEKNDRKLDVEQKEDVKKNLNADFSFDLKNPWLPVWEEYCERIPREMQNLNWRDEKSLWKLPFATRREVYRHWLLEAHHEARELLPEVGHRLERNAEHRAALERDRKLALLREMEVVGMTTTAVSKYQQLLKELRPEVVIVEEAAEVLEAHILTALHPRTQHVILIGDHQQLRPSTAVYRLSKNFHLDVSLFERLIKNGADHETLLQQRRMHPKVSRLIKPYYPELRDHPITENHPNVMGTPKRTFFFKHNNFEDAEGESHSKENSFEANFISALCAHLVASGYDESQITVLSPYLGQVRLLKNKLKRDATTMEVQVTAVDNFQGEENDIIVISLVRSNRNKSMGFLAVENRINVALTRAKHGMFIIGNADMLKGHKLWDAITKELAADDSISDRMPLLHKESGEEVQVKTCDDISLLLDNPLHETPSGCSGGGFTSFAGSGPGASGGRPGGGMVADRWAELGNNDRGGRGDRDRGKGDRGGDRDRGKGDRDRGKGGEKGKSGKSGGGRDRDDRGGGQNRDRDAGRDKKVVARWG